MTLETIQTLNHLLGWGGLLGILCTAILVLDLYTKRHLAPHIQAWGMHLAFFSVLFGVLGALFYSEVLGFLPCGLCWFERIFLFPQLFILGIAIVKKELGAPLYGIVLSLVGLLISLYHHAIQMGLGASMLPCPASGGDCSKRILFEFGFITFPLLSAILFAFLIALYVYIQKIRN